MTFKELAKYIEKIEGISSRVEITKVLAELFAKLTPEEYEKSIYLLLGRLTPKYEMLNFGMAEKMVIRAVTMATQTDSGEFVREYKKSGDLGDTAQKYKSQQVSMLESDPSILEVYKDLVLIAKAGGKGSQDEKIGKLSNLIQILDPLSVRYIVRIPLGVLRLGFSDMTVLDGLSWMKKKDKSIRPILQKAFHVNPDLGLVGRTLKEKGLSEVEKIEPDIFTPILMMRAERLSSGKEIVEQIGKCAVEPKFDGFRLQIHKNGGEVRLYTRGLDDATFMYPDVVRAVDKEVEAESAIFEGEAIGYDIESGTFLPFQETVQRKRKYDIEEMSKKIPLKLFAFDLLYLNGKNYISKPFSKRRKALASILKKDTNPEKYGVILAGQSIIDDPDKIELMFEEYVAKGLEGIIAKRLDGKYEPGARGWNWIKFKRSYSSKIDDTIDCLVMGYDFGKGKRTKFGIGAFLAGVYDDKLEKFVTVAKIGTGLTDEEWRQLKIKCQKFSPKANQPMADKVQKKPSLYDIDNLMECDVWVDPGIVVEIKADEISRSTIHTAGRIMKPSKSGSALTVDVAGFALRFPRLERFRDDKSAEDVTTVKEVGKMFTSQKNN